MTSSFARQDDGHISRVMEVVCYADYGQATDITELDNESTWDIGAKTYNQWNHGLEKPIRSGKLGHRE